MIVIYSLIMLIVLALSINAFHRNPAKNADLLLTTILLLSSIVICTLLTLKFGLLNIALISPILDFPLAVLVYQMWLRHREQWKLIVVGGLIAQLTLHVDLIVMWNDNVLTPRLLNLYVAEVNTVLYVVLATLGGVGLFNSIGKNE